MTIDGIKTVCFVGAGTMGCFNALVAAVAGYDTVLWDFSREALAQVVQRTKEMGDYLILQGRFTSEQIEKGLTRIFPVADAVEAAARADLLSESVFERLDLKRQVHGRFDELCLPHTIMTTNTSTLVVSGIESAVKRGDRFAALHAHLFADLFDIVGGPRTSPQTIDILVRYVRSLGGIPIVNRRERPGYLYNALLSSILGGAMMLFLDGRATIQDIDRAWMKGFGYEAGPFAWMDGVGINVVYDAVTESLEDPDPNKAALNRKIVAFLQPLMERGDLGVKTGKGFYSYPDPIFAQAGFSDESGPLDHLVDVLFTNVAVTALMLVIEDYASLEEVDRALMAAQHRVLGPFGMMDRRGLDVCLGLIENHMENLPSANEDKEKIKKFLDAFIKRGELGVKTGRGFYLYPNPAYEQPGFLLGEYREGPYAIP